MTVPAATTTSTSASLSSGVSRFSEARLVPDTLAMAWRSLITMVRNFGESFDVLLQPIMFTVMFGELFGGAIAGDVRAAIIGSLLVLAITAPLTVFRYQRRNA